jgi:hypothetical protein
VISSYAQAICTAGGNCWLAGETPKHYQVFLDFFLGWIGVLTDMFIWLTFSLTG